MSGIAVRITVNGRAREATVAAETLLLDLLRDGLDLTGTHAGCRTGHCGACTVLLDGKTVKSCTVLAARADGAELTTIEGLAQGGELHPLQQAFWDEHAFQCGFCTPGLLLSAVELLAHSPHPDEPAIRRALAGTLCRCTGYDNAIRAVQRAAAGGST